MKRSRILIIKTGTTYKRLRNLQGDFDQWLINSTNNPDIKWELKSLSAVKPEEIPKFGGIIFTGAHRSLTQPYPLFNHAKQIFEKVIENEIPSLAICFGHQLINYILGGKVINNPFGFEAGIVDIQLSMEALADPLFSGMDSGKIEVYSVHSDIVSKAGEGVEILAWDSNSYIQATRYMDFIHTLQFHPEFNKMIMEYYIKENWDILMFEHEKNPLKAQHPEEILKRNRNISKGKRILRNFIEIVEKSI